MKKRGLALLMLAAVAVAACGGGDDDAGSDTTTSEGGANSEPTEATGSEPTEATSSEPTQSTNGEQAEFEPIRFLYTRQPESAAVFVAEDEGIFDEYGLDVTLEEGPADGNTHTAIIGGSAELGHSTPAAILLSQSEGQDLVFASGQSASTQDNPRSFLMASASSGITDLAGLQGKRIAVPALGGGGELGTRATLERAGIDPDAVTFVVVPFPQMADALNAGNADAAVLVLPFSTQVEQNGGVVLSTPVDFAPEGVDVLVGVVAARRDWAEENEAALVAFQSALAEAGDLIAEDPQIAVDATAKYTGVDPAILTGMPVTNVHPYITLDEAKVWFDILVDNDLVSPDLDLASLILPAPS